MFSHKHFFARHKSISSPRRFISRVFVAFPRVSENARQWSAIKYHVRSPVIDDDDLDIVNDDHDLCFLFQRPRSFINDLRMLPNFIIIIITLVVSGGGVVDMTSLFARA